MDDDTRFICCEPNLSLPQDISIEKLKKDATKAVTKVCVDSDMLDVTASKKELVDTFSVNRNDYLKCKWDKFLKHVPSKVLVIKPYLEYKKKQDPVRRMILNGDFYLNNGNLIPVPRIKRTSQPK